MKQLYLWISTVLLWAGIQSVNGQCPHDSVPPSVICPPTVTIACDDLTYINGHLITAYPGSETGDIYQWCNTNTTVTTVGFPPVLQVTRTWSVQDICGNKATCTHTLFIECGPCDTMICDSLRSPTTTARTNSHLTPHEGGSPPTGSLTAEGGTGSRHSIDPHNPAKMFTVFPNPTRDGKITVQMQHHLQGVATLQVVSLQGPVLMAEKPVETTIQLPIDQPGHYLVRLITAASISTQQVTVQ